MKTETYELSKGYVIPRILNGCWQLSLGHSLNGPLDFDDVKILVNSGIKAAAIVPQEIMTESFHHTSGDISPIIT